MTDDLIERLRAKRHVYPVQGGGDTTGRCYTTDDGYRLINPNGPEAAARIATQQEAINGAGGHLLMAQAILADGPTRPLLEIVGALSLEIAKARALLSKHGERT